MQYWQTGGYVFIVRLLLVKLCKIFGKIANFSSIPLMKFAYLCDRKIRTGMNDNFTNVEKAYIGDVKHRFPTNIPYITVENFPKLGKLTAFRFLEWAAEHPDGVISLPTGKTPEYFIAWVKKVLNEWDTKEGAASREESGLLLNKKPDLRGLHFVQIDEFYPIDPRQHNSFYNYVQKYYVEDFGLDASKGIFINCEQIPLADGRHFTEVFPDGVIDLSLRYRNARSAAEDIQQKSIS